MINQAPEVISFVICDAGLRCMTTGKYFLNGIYNGFNLPCIPFTIPVPVNMYIAVTDGRGNMTFTIKIVDDEDDTTLIESNCPAEFSDPTNIGEMFCSVAPLTFNHEGVYRFELWCGDELLKVRRVNCNLWKQPKNTNDEGEEWKRK